MPDRGLLERAQIAAGALSGGGRAPWTLAGARWAQLTYEVAQRAALRYLPCDVNRPVPCYARLFVLEAPASPVGSFRLALLSVGGRYRMLPKNVVADGIVDGPLEALSKAFGGPLRAGLVSLERSRGRVEARIADAQGELATLHFPALYAVDPAMLRWDPWLAFADDGERLELIEYAAKAGPAEAFLTKGAELETPANLAREHTWRALRNINTVSAAYVEGELTLTAPEVQQAIV
jgi:hypothetical protein